MTKEFTTKLNIPGLESLEGLDDKSKELALKILSEYSETGYSDVMNKLIQEDYDEIPVDIITFIDDPQYLGKGLLKDDGTSSVFPYWRELLQEMFPDPLKPCIYNTLALSGAIGLGKSFIAVVCMLYELYRMLCLKDPYNFYGLQPIDKITFATLNITLDASKGVAWDKMQQLLQSSPWFLSHGSVKGITNVEWVPPKGIELIAGSQAQHILGRALFSCLDGDTEILTNFGDKKLSELVGTNIKVASVNNDGIIEYSDSCTVLPTAVQSEEYQIELEDGTVIKCTPEHRFLLLDGTYKEAQYLTESDEIFDSSPEKTEYANFIDSILSSRGRFIKDRDIYKERHHIVPKCCNGQDCPSNIVELLPEEHYIAHYLLAKENAENYKLGLALNCMLTLNRCHDVFADALKYRDSRLIAAESCRRNSSGSNNGMYGKAPWNKGKTKETDIRVQTYAKKCGQTKIGVKLGPNSEATRKKKSEATRLRYKLHPETFAGRNTGKVAITDGTNTMFVDKSLPLPEGFEYGNSGTRGQHNMHRYYADEEMRARKSASASGPNNANYGHGERQSGGRNGKATYDYWYEDKYFECRKYLLEYLNSLGIEISDNALRNIQNGTYGKRTERKFAVVIQKLSWRLKDENQVDRKENS